MKHGLSPAEKQRALVHYGAMAHELESRRLSAPATLVQPVEPMPMTAMRFARSLDERSPHVRSSTACITPMEFERVMHVADRIVVGACIVASVVLVAFMVGGVL